MALKYEMSEIIDESFKIYRKNFKLLYILSLASAALGAVFSVFRFMVNSNDSINIIVMILVAIVVIYSSLRIKIMLILFIDSVIKDQEFSLNECFHQSSKYFWNYLTTLLGIIMIILLPTLIIAFTIPDLMMKITVGLIFGIVILITVFYLNFAPLCSVLRAKTASYFRTSIDLVKIDPLLVLSMIGLGILVEIFLYFTTDLLNISPSLGAISMGQFIEILINALIAPLILIAYILLFKHLISLQESYQEG